MARFYFISVLVFVSLSSVAQNQRNLRHYVRIKPKHCIWEIRDTLDRIDTCRIDSGSVVKTEKIIKTKCCDSIITKIDTIRQTVCRYDTIMRKVGILIDTAYWNTYGSKNIFKKTKPVKANITISKDSLLVNFWLFRVRDSSSNTCRLVEPPTAMFRSSRKYYIQLQNRQFASFGFRNLELGALSIPIKIRLGYTTSDKVKIPANAVADITNIGTYIGYRFGRIRYWYNKYEEMKTSSSAFSLGAFFGVSNDKLDSLSTFRGGINGLKKDETRNSVSLSYGLTFQVDVVDFRFGILFGIDNAFGDNKSIWNYHNKHWIGIGVGYKLVLFRNPEK